MGDVGCAQNGAGPGQQAQVGHRGLGQAVLGLFHRLVEQGLQSRARVGQAEQQVLVSGPEIHVGDHHAFALLGQCGRQVKRDDALAHTALAATHGDDARSRGLG